MKSLAELQAIRDKARASVNIVVTEYTIGANAIGAK